MGKKVETSPEKKMDVDPKPSKTERPVVEIDYETRMKSVSSIAHPMASKKLNKKVLKVVKKGNTTTESCSLNSPLFDFEVDLLESLGQIQFEMTKTSEFQICN